MQIESPKTKEWIRLVAGYVAAEVAERGIKPVDMTPELMRELILDASAKITALCEEMIEGRSERSKIAKDVLALDIYTTIVRHEGMENIIRKYSN